MLPESKSNMRNAHIGHILPNCPVTKGLYYWTQGNTKCIIRMPGIENNLSKSNSFIQWFSDLHNDLMGKLYQPENYF